MRDGPQAVAVKGDNVEIVHTSRQAAVDAIKIAAAMLRPHEASLTDILRDAYIVPDATQIAARAALRFLNNLDRT